LSLFKSIDDGLIHRIVCPLCKSGLEWTSVEATCGLCSQRFRASDNLWSFLLQYPEGLSAMNHAWKHGQDAYEEWAHGLDDDYERELAEADEVREIYTEEFSLFGSVLDVGGGDGRLRHYLPEGTLYVGIDPYPALLYVDQRPNLQRVYPVLKEPCFFLQGTAEHLPFAPESFDFVHMRSVLDHLSDPFLPLFESRRVLRPGGRLMIGVHVVGGKSPIPEGAGIRVQAARFRKKMRDKGFRRAIRVAQDRILGVSRDEHLWHPTYDSLLELVHWAQFTLEKTHWQKAPNEHVVYLMARKK
jgi:SAM-dependent methyltransferase